VIAPTAEPLPTDWPAAPRPEAFHGLLGEVVESLAPHTEADPVAIYAQALAVFGNQVGRGVHFRADGAYHGLNLFVNVVGASSASRKGTSFSRVREMFAATDASILDRIAHGLSSGEGLIWRVRDAAGEDVDGIHDKRLIVFEGEFGKVLKVMGREGNTLSAIIREAWDSGKLTTLTKKDSATATNAHVTIIGHITRDELRRHLSLTDCVNGFGNRFLWFAAKRSRLLPLGSDWPDLMHFGLRLRRQQALAMKLGEIRRTPDADELWVSVYRDLTAPRPGLVGAITSRAEAQVMRIAAILAAVEVVKEIRVDHLRAALAVWDYSLRSCWHIFGEGVGEPNADRILRMLKMVGEQGLTRTQISDLFSHNLKAPALQDALERLRASGLAFSAELGGTTGRPTEQWFHHAVR
jgi:hypothetical protein